MTLVYLVEGEHPYVPGRPQSIHATAESANAEAASLVSVMTARPATATDWRAVLAAWGEANDYDDDSAWVEVTALELRG